MRNLEQKRYREIREGELTEIVNSLHLHDLFSGKKGLHKSYGGLLVSSAIRRILQPKLISGVRLSWGQIMSTDGESLSGEQDLMVCVCTPVRYWDIISYTIERTENVKAIFEVKHSFPTSEQIKSWLKNLRPVLSGFDQKDPHYVGIIVLWDEKIKENNEFSKKEAKLRKNLIV